MEQFILLKIEPLLVGDHATHKGLGETLALSSFFVFTVLRVHFTFNNSEVIQCRVSNPAFYIALTRRYPSPYHRYLHLAISWLHLPPNAVPTPVFTRRRHHDKLFPAVLVGKYLRLWLHSTFHFNDGK